MEKVIEKVISKIENIIIKIFSNKWLYYFIAIILAEFIYYKELSSKLTNLNVEPSKYINYYLIGSAIVLLVCTICILIIKSKKELHIKYLLVALLLGFSYLFASPMISQSDESFHFIRAYQIAKGNLISPVDEVSKEAYDYFPSSVIKTIYDDDDKYPEYKKYQDSYNESKIKLNEKDKVKVNVRCSSYVFLNYIFHSFGIKIGMVLKLSPYIMCMLGRITGMIGCIILITIGIKRLPCCKNVMMLILLSPVTIAYMSAISADGILNATSFLFIATVLMLINKKEKLKCRDYIELLLLILFVSTCKVAYLPLVGLLILLPKDCFKNNIHKYIFSIVAIGIGVLFCLISMRIGNISISTSTDNSNTLNTMLFFAYQLINTIFNQGLEIVQNIFGSYYLYQIQVRPFGILSVIYIIVLILAYLNEKEFLNIRYISKFVVSLIGILITVLVFYAMAMGNTEVGSPLIIGVQGRYLIPVLFILPFFSHKNINITDSKNKFIFLKIAMVINLYVLLTMITTFII